MKKYFQNFINGTAAESEKKETPAAAATKPKQAPPKPKPEKPPLPQTQKEVPEVKTEQPEPTEDLPVENLAPVQLKEPSITRMILELEESKADDFERADDIERRLKRMRSSAASNCETASKAQKGPARFRQTPEKATDSSAHTLYPRKAYVSAFRNRLLENDSE